MQLPLPFDTPASAIVIPYSDLVDVEPDDLIDCGRCGALEAQWMPFYYDYMCYECAKRDGPQGDDMLIFFEPGVTYESLFFDFT